MKAVPKPPKEVFDVAFGLGDDVDPTMRHMALQEVMRWRYGPYVSELPGFSLTRDDSAE